MKALLAIGAWLAVIAGLFGALWMYQERDRQFHNALGVDREQSPPAAPLRASDAFESERTAVDAHLTAPHETDVEGQPLAGRNASAAALVRGATPGTMPTAEGLWSATVELWSQPEFLREPRVAEIVDAMGLPTLADCEKALEDSECAEMLTHTQLDTLAVADAAMHNSLDVEELADIAQRDLEALCARLDERTGYPYWLELAELYRAWSE